MGDTAKDKTLFNASNVQPLSRVLEAGNAVIAVATESHRKSLVQRLQEHGVDTIAALNRGVMSLWTLPRPSRSLWLVICLTQCDFLESQVICSRQPHGRLWGAGCNLWGMWINPVGARQGGCGYSGGTTL